MNTYVSIDVSKSRLDCHLHPHNMRMSCPNTPTGIAQIISVLSQNKINLIIMEAPGGYGRQVYESLHNKGFKVRIVNPCQVKRLCKSSWLLSKSS